MDFEVLNDIKMRFSNTSDITPDVTFICLAEYAQITTIIEQFMTSNKELIRAVLDVLCYRLNIGFDKFLLKRDRWPITNAKGEYVMAKPLMLTLEHKDKIVFVMDGGISGNMLHDFMLLLDKLLETTIISNKHPINPLMNMADGFRC